MSTYYLTERMEIGDTAEDGDGRLVVSARVARAGNVQLYLGSEMGVADKEVVRVYRPEEEVFNTDSMKTFPHRYVTLGHPKGPADFEKHAVGWLGDEVARDGEFIRVPMTVAAKKATDAIKDGTRELSVGYTSAIDFTPGKTPSGEDYDAKMTNIVVDHVAIVKYARGGSQLRIGDWRTVDDSDSALNPNSGGRHMADTTHKVVFDGLTIETSEQGKQAIEALTKRLGDSQDALKQALADKDAAIATHDAAIAKKDAEIDDLKGKQLSDADLDKRVTERADLISTAKAIGDADYTGKSDAEIRKLAVATKLGDKAVDGKSEAYIAARFDILAEDAQVDPVRQAMRTEDRNAKNPVNDARAKMFADLENGHKPQTH